jgi:hypothetical protein
MGWAAMRERTSLNQKERRRGPRRRDADARPAPWRRCAGRYFAPFRRSPPVVLRPHRRRAEGMRAGAEGALNPGTSARSHFAGKPTRTLHARAVVAPGESFRTPGWVP